MVEEYLKEENSCVKTENNLLKENIRRVNNIRNGHKTQNDSVELAKDLQNLLNVLEKQRVLISSLERHLDSTQCDYESLLEKSLQDARLSSTMPSSNHFLAELIIKEETAVEELQVQVNNKVVQTARTISDIKSAYIHQNAELIQNTSLPTKSPTLHKSGARANESKKNKYLLPLN